MVGLPTIGVKVNHLVSNIVNMATRQGQAFPKHQRERTKIGDFKLTGNDRDVNLRISNDLDSEPFPNVCGQEVSVYLDYRDGRVLLEVVPTGGQ